MLALICWEWDMERIEKQMTADFRSQNFRLFSHFMWEGHWGMTSEGVRNAK